MKKRSQRLRGFPSPLALCSDRLDPQHQILCITMPFYAARGWASGVAARPSLSLRKHFGCDGARDDVARGMMSVRRDVAAPRSVSVEGKLSQTSTGQTRTGCQRGRHLDRPSSPPALRRRISERVSRPVPPTAVWLGGSLRHPYCCRHRARRSAWVCIHIRMRTKCPRCIALLPAVTVVCYS